MRDRTDGLVQANIIILEVVWSSMKVWISLTGRYGFIIHTRYQVGYMYYTPSTYHRETQQVPREVYKSTGAAYVCLLPVGQTNIRTLYDPTHVEFCEATPIGLVDEPKVSLYGRETDHLRSACRCVA